jgi:hypothetical protein
MASQSGRWVKQEDVNVATGCQCLEDVQARGRQAREAEERQARREVDQPRLQAEALAGALEPLGGAREPEPFPEPPPQLGLPHNVRLQGRPRPVHVVAGSPRAEHLRPVERIPVEELHDVAHAAEAAHLADLVRALPEVRGEGPKPRLLDAAVDEFEQLPHRTFGTPRVFFGVDPRGRRQGVLDQPAREREIDVRADAVDEPGGRAQTGGHSLSEPALHAPCRNGDHLGGKRILQGLNEQLSQGLYEAIGSFCAMDVKHGLGVLFRLAPPGGPAREIRE